MRPLTPITLQKKNRCLTCLLDKNIEIIEENIVLLEKKKIFGQPFALIEKNYRLCVINVDFVLPFKWRNKVQIRQTAGQHSSI